MPFLVKAAGMAGALYALIVAVAWLGQRHLMYVPDATRVAPDKIGLKAHERILSTPDGARLVTWSAPAREGFPTILYFHGNAGNLASRALLFSRYQAAGFGLLMMSWRGYSGSTGRPSEANNVADARLAYDVLRGDGIAADRIVLYGESLGTGVAVQIAAEKPVAAVILDAPYTSIVDVALLSYPYLPVRPLLLDRYETMSHIGRVRAPLLVIHGEKDRIIPVSMGKTVFAAANEPKKLILFPEGNHVDLDEHGAIEQVTDWLRSTIRLAASGTGH
ncbi:MAG: alpha/beta hydrolase [Proteobacteria bacterium]|nr:alpha/beta hydrolase [Pseudomonadota bacterium]